MAKMEEKNLRTKMKEAKTFHDLLAVLVSDHKRSMRRHRQLLEARHQAEVANRPLYEKSLRGHESELRRLEARRKRYEQYQGNKKIPAALRKKIADLETEILRSEHSADELERSCLRYRRDDLATLFEQVEQISNPPQPLATVNKSFRVGKKYPGLSITRAYDGHVWEVLKGHFERLPREKGERTSFKIVAPLPEKAEYLQLKARHFTRTVEALVDDAFGTVDELQGEPAQEG